MSEVVLSYQRVKGNLCSGQITWEETTKATFEELGYATMITLLGTILHEHPDCSAMIHRTDRRGLVPMQLPTHLEIMLRTDPAAAIKEMSPSQVILGVGDPTTRIGDAVEVKVQKGLRIGHDSFADAFGDRIYCRARGNAIECPGCGKWVSVDTGPYANFIICECLLVLPATAAGSDWWTVSTSMLLGEHAKHLRFFLPRAWNETKSPWINRQDLEKKYNDWLKEKSNV